jgi:hypothetical protein
MKTPFMNLLTKTFTSCLVIVSLTLIGNKLKTQKLEPVSPMPQQKNYQPKIQAAILLDVSNSMDGLIDQAKAQLWNMVSVMGKAKCNEAAPQIEIALYEYGRTTNDEKQGYVKQLTAFTTDLDQVSQSLFNVKTDGGDEYCGHVIYTSIKDLKWDTSAANYKVIFIAGNEDFLQGGVAFTKACAVAKQKGVIVNTIYCGDKLQGIQEHWNLGSECGNGSFTNINKDAKLEEIDTPYDSVLFSLNEKLNSTYIGYGAYALEGASTQLKMDKLNYSHNKSAALKRVAVKSKKEVYKNSTWDLVDAETMDEKFTERLDLKTLPDSLKNKSRQELKQIIKNKNNERTTLQKNIADETVKRENYIAAERLKKHKADTSAVLETEVEKIIRQQATRFNMRIQ